MGEHFTREPVNVPDLLERDKLVRRIRAVRDEMVAQKACIAEWNAAHPEEESFDTRFEDALIAWCDGEGPLPEVSGG